MDEPKYTYEEGLKVLEYLGITNITGEEKQSFKENWDGVYAHRGSSLIPAIWILYAQVLPFTYQEGDRDSLIVATISDADFDKRLEATRLEEDLKQGKSLQEILEKGPHKFVIKVDI